MAGCGKTIAELQRFLIARGSAGGTLQEFVAALGKAQGHVSTALTVAKDGGLLEWWPEPLGRCSNRRRWYAAGHRPPFPPDPIRVDVRPPPRASANGIGALVDPRFHVEHAPSVVDAAQCRPWADAAAVGYGS